MKMWKILVILLVLGTIFIKCNSTINSSQETTNDSIIQKDRTVKLNIDDIIVQRVGEKAEIQEINGNGVFVIQMSTKESDFIEAADPSAYETFSENANDISMRASELFEKFGIKSEWSDRRYLRIDQGDRKYLLDTRLKNIAGKFCIFYKANSKPELIENEAITKEMLKNYFNK